MNTQAQRKSTSERFPWLRDLLEPLRSYYREAFTISFFTNLLALAVPLFTLQVYDRVVSHNATSTLIALVFGVILALVFDFVLRQGRSRLLQNVALHIDAKMGRALYGKLIALPMRVLEERPTSYWQSVFQDMVLLRNVLSGSSAMMVLDIPFAILFLLVIFLLAPVIAWLLLLLIPVFLLLTYLSSKMQTTLNAQETERQQSREALIAELAAGRTTVKSLMIDKALKQDFEDLHAKAIHQSYKRGTLADNFIALGQSLGQLTTVIMVTAGALAIIDRELTIGALIATTMLTGRIVAPLSQLLANWKQFAGAKEAAERLEKLFALPSERDVATLKRERPKGHLIVEHASFAYGEGQAPAVLEAAFKIGPGDLIGIVGKNGSGKSTLVKMLLGLYRPSKGRILLDDADINQFSREEMASWIGYVPQECFLFSGTIKSNITKAFPHASDDKILAAAKLAGADSFIINLPNGYDTDIGEGGHTLSGGMRQRIAIARALLRNPPVLLLDEVSNHLDMEAEKALTQTLGELKKDRTIITVTHSPMLLKACDKIIVMDRGRIVLAGPSGEVMARIGSNPEQAGGAS